MDKPYLKIAEEIPLKGKSPYNFLKYLLVLAIGTLLGTQIQKEWDQNSFTASRTNVLVKINKLIEVNKPIADSIMNVAPDFKEFYSNPHYKSILTLTKTGRWSCTDDGTIICFTRH